MPGSPFATAGGSAKGKEEPEKNVIGKTGRGGFLGGRRFAAPRLTFSGIDAVVGIAYLTAADFQQHREKSA